MIYSSSHDKVGCYCRPDEIIAQSMSPPSIDYYSMLTRPINVRLIFLIELIVKSNKNPLPHLTCST